MSNHKKFISYLLFIPSFLLSFLLFNNYALAIDCDEECAGICNDTAVSLEDCLDCVGRCNEANAAVCDPEVDTECDTETAVCDPETAECDTEVIEPPPPPPPPLPPSPTPTPTPTPAPIITPAATANQTAAESYKIEDPLGIGPAGGNYGNTIPILANRLIQAALGISGVLALLSFIYGGILYMLVGINPDNVKKGKEIMKWAVVGLVIIFSSYAIVKFLLETVLAVK